MACVHRASVTVRARGTSRARCSGAARGNTRRRLLGGGFLGGTLLLLPISPSVAAEDDSPPAPEMGAVVEEVAVDEEAPVADAGEAAPDVEVLQSLRAAPESAEPEDLTERLLARSAANKAKNDQARLDNYYNRSWRINRLLGKDVLPEPCDPRIPEFTNSRRCATLLPGPDTLR
mmetsp:Transcript_30635/g.99603  ORF Transcript_30635/g.99603 Transcript_30635/m.99603 type:complete len:175 (-) Transcript_30635:22-546(-)